MCAICGVSDSASFILAARAGVLMMLGITAIVVAPLAIFAWRLWRLERASNGTHPQKADA